MKWAGENLSLILTYFELARDERTKTVTLALTKFCNGNSAKPSFLGLFQYQSEGLLLLGLKGTTLVGKKYSVEMLKSAPVAGSRTKQGNPVRDLKPSYPPRVGADSDVHESATMGDSKLGGYAPFMAQ